MRALCKCTVLQLEVKNKYTGTGAYAVIFIEIFFNDGVGIIGVLMDGVVNNTPCGSLVLGSSNLKTRSE